MELYQLEDLWKKYDQHLEARAEVNEALLKTVSIDKVRSLLGTIRLSAIFEWAVYFLFLSMVIPFAIQYVGTMKFFLPALILILYSVHEIYINGRRLYLTSSLDYAAPITTIQKQVQELHVNFTRERKHLYWQIPTFFIPLCIVAAQGFVQLDLYLFPKAFLYISITTLLVTPLIVWFVGKFPDVGLEKARAFLNEISAFEEEE